MRRGGRLGAALAMAAPAVPAQASNQGTNVMRRAVKGPLRLMPPLTHPYQIARFGRFLISPPIPAWGMGCSGKSYMYPKNADCKRTRITSGSNISS